MADTGHETTELNEQMTEAIRLIEQAQQKLNSLINATPTGELRNKLTDIGILQESAIQKLR